MGNKEPNIDDFFRHAEALIKKMHEYMAGKSFDEKFATAMLNTTDYQLRYLFRENSCLLASS